MSEQKPENGQQNGMPAKNAKANGTTPSVTARRPLSKAEYARTTQASPDTTSVIPAVRDDQPAPPKAPAPSADDRPTQTMKAVPAQPPAKKPEPKKAEPKKAPSRPEAKAAPAPKGAGAGAVGAAAAAGGAAAAASASTQAAAAPAAASAAAPATAPAAKPQQKAEPKPAPAKKQKPESKKAPKQAESAGEVTKTAPAATGRSARLKLSHVEPWSVTKMAFVVSVALMVVSVVAVTVFWLVMQITGVWGALNDSVSNVLADDASGFDITEYLGFGRVVGLTLLVSSLNVIFMTALATIAAHLYNLAAGILGGIEMTFGERQ